MKKMKMKMKKRTGGGTTKKNQKYGFFQNKITFTLDDYK